MHFVFEGSISILAVLVWFLEILAVFWSALYLGARMLPRSGSMDVIGTLGVPQSAKACLVIYEFNSTTATSPLPPTIQTLIMAGSSFVDETCHTHFSDLRHVNYRLDWNSHPLDRGEFMQERWWDWVDNREKEQY